MGIKFHCPQGHKLNVKAFLAGKKGVCPKCGTKLRIPEASEPGLGGDDADDSDGGKVPAGHPGNGAARAAVATAAPVMPAAVAMPAARPAVSAAMPVPAPAMPAMPAAIPAAIPAPAVSDPIAEAPAAIWYVRPPSGGQFGPARGDVMRKWITEGRVSSDSLVWREGWTDWQTAGKLFPNLQSASAAAAPSPAPTGVTRAARTVSRYQAKKSGGNSTAIALLIFLAIVCVALVAVLLYVLFNQT
jgi:hypothetical protein